jgi:hypothetical protein
MPTLPQQFPDLPDNLMWSQEVHAAHDILKEGYQAAFQILRQEDGDAM